DLECCYIADLAAADRAPGEGHVAPAEGDPPPVPGELEARPLHPPDVVARLIDQLELERILRCIALEPEAQLVVLGQVQWQLAAQCRPAAAPLEVEVDAKCAAAIPAGVLCKVEAHAARGRGLPGVDRLEVVEHARLCRARVRRGRG